MPDTAAAAAQHTDLGETIRRLEQDRQRHAREIALIDAILEQVTRAVTDPPRVPLLDDRADDQPEPRLQLLLPPRSAKRGRFEKTGEQSVLDFTRQQGNPTTADINAHWRREGRKGVANVILLRLLKAGLIRRVPDPTVRGSRYRVTDQVTTSNSRPNPFARDETPSMAAEA